MLPQHIRASTNHTPSRYLARKIWNDAAEDRAKLKEMRKDGQAEDLGKKNRLEVVYVNGAGFQNGTTTARYEGRVRV